MLQRDQPAEALLIRGLAVASADDRRNEELGSPVAALVSSKEPSWRKLGEKGLQSEPHDFIAEGDKVVVLTTVTLAGESVEAVDVLTYNEAGKLIGFEQLGDNHRQPGVCELTRCLWRPRDQPKTAKRKDDRR